MTLSDFDKGRIEGAIAFWDIMSHYDQIPVPAVDDVLNLPPGTTRDYLQQGREK